MVATHANFYFNVPQTCLTSGNAEVADFCEKIRLAEASGDTTGGDIPVLVFWDMNSLSNTGNFTSHWHAQAQCVADILGSRPHSSAAILVCRKAVPTTSRRSFNHAVTSFLEKRNVDCDFDLSFYYKDAAPGASAVLPAMYCFSQKSAGQRNPWASTRLARGDIADIAFPRAQDMALPFDVDNFAFEAVGEYRNLSPAQRSNFITASGDSDNLYAKVLDAAFSNFNPGLKNKQQKRMCVFVMLDPLEGSLPLAVQKYMIAEHKNEGGCDVRGLVLAGDSTRQKLVIGSLEQLVFQAWYQKKYSIPGHSFTQVSPYNGDMVNPPQLTVTRLDEEGGLRLQTELLKTFLNCETAAPKAKILWEEVEARAQKADAPKWKATRMSGGLPSLDEHGSAPPVPTQQLEKSYETLEKLLESVQPLADIPSNGANFRIIITPDRQGWAKCVRGTTVAKGDIFVSCGSGQRLDVESAQRKMVDRVGFLCKLEDDNVMVSYRSDTVTLTSLYNLHSQITLEGNRKVELSHHHLRPKSGASGLDRFDVELKRQRYWVCVKANSDTSGLRWDNVLRIVDVSKIPNEMVQLVWELKKDMQGGIAALIFERPYLGWSKSQTFETGDWFRWA